MIETAEQEFLQLVNQNQGIIRKVCHLYGRNDADKDDLYQEIVIQLWKSFDSFLGEQADTDEEKLKEEKLKEMYAAISRLTEVEKAIVMLFLEDKSYDEMEEILGISSGTLRVKMNRIKEKLRTLTKAQAYGT